MRWTAVFVYLSLVAFTTALLAILLGWSGWLLALLIVLVLPAALGVGIALRHAVRWTPVLSYLSAVALLAGVASQLLGSSSARNWFILLWIALLPAVTIALLSHPMRRPGLGFFVAFWAMVAVGWLFVLQILHVAGVVQGSGYTGSASWPLAALGIWFVLGSAGGYAAKPFGAITDSLGLLTGIALVGISITTWTGTPDARQIIGVVAAVGFCLWAGGIGWVLWGFESPFRAVLLQRISTEPTEGPNLVAEARPTALSGDA